MKLFTRKQDGERPEDSRIGLMLGQVLSAMAPEDECPSPEDLAALAEGKVSKKHRSRLLAHVASCARCSEVHLMICEMAQEETPAGRPDYSWQKRRLVPLAAAAGLLLAIISVPLLLSLNFKGSTSETPAPYVGTPARMEKPAPSQMDGKGKHPARPRALEEERKEPPGRKALEAGDLAPAEPAKAAGEKSLTPPPSAQARPTGGTAPPGAAGNEPAREFGLTPKVRMAEAPVMQEKSPGRAAAPKAAAEAPRVPAGLSDTGYTRGIYRKRVGIGRDLRAELLSLDSVLSDRKKIEGLYNDLKLDPHEFPLQDITKIVIQRSKQERMNAEPETNAPDTLQADISLGEGGVLTIVVVEENRDVDSPGKLKYKDRPKRIPVGC